MLPGKCGNQISTGIHHRNGSERLNIPKICKGESVETEQTIPDGVVESDTISNRTRMANSCSLHSHPFNGGCSTQYTTNPSPIFAIQGKITSKISLVLLFLGGFYKNIKIFIIMSNCF